MDENAREHDLRISPKRRFGKGQRAPKMQYESNQFAIASLWMEYFNNLKKCWEPLLEKVVLHGLLKKVHVVVYFQNLKFLIYI